MIISTHDLTKTFFTETVETSALSDIGLNVSEGEFVSLMGPSGCGKSTLMNILGMIDSPSSGSYQFLGEEVAKYGERKRAGIRKANIGFIFQSYQLINDLTVFENVELPLIYTKVPTIKRKQLVTRVIEKLNMQHRIHHYPTQLSGGQQQRVAVARAIVIEPKLILADEPTGNLDSSHGQEVMEILKNLNQEGSTIVMVTHSEYDAAFGDRIVRLSDGVIQPSQTDAELLTKGIELRA